jgi:YD repeat-containing protein
VLRSRRVESTSPDFRVAVVAWDEETGNALRLEYDGEGALLRHAIATRFPQETWDGDVVGEAVWYDTNDHELRREPVHLGRGPFGPG